MKLVEGEIINGISVGKFYIGMHEEELENMIKDYTVETFYGIRLYKIENVSFKVDTYSKTLFAIIVREGFKGKFKGDIGIGSKLSDIAKYGEICEDDEAEVFEIKDYEGISFGLDYEYDNGLDFSRYNKKNFMEYEMMLPIKCIVVFTEIEEDDDDDEWD